jgi:hypothetical protein
LVDFPGPAMGPERRRAVLFFGRIASVMAPRTGVVASPDPSFRSTGRDAKNGADGERPS